MQKLIFLVGPYRGGISLLYRLLQGHPEIDMFYEMGAQDFWPLIREHSIASNWADKLDFWNNSLTRHNLLRRNWPRKSRKDLAESLYKCRAELSEATYGGEKDPGYSRVLSRIASEFPDAKIIIIWRDPEQVAESVMRQKGSSSSFFRGQDATLRVLSYMDKLIVEWSKLELSNRDYRWLKLEDLQNDPEKTLEPIWEYLSLAPVAVTKLMRSPNSFQIPQEEHNQKALKGSIDRVSTRKQELSHRYKQLTGQLRSNWALNHPQLLNKGVFNEPSQSARMTLRTLILLRLALWKYDFYKVAFSLLPVSLWNFLRRITRSQQTSNS